MIEAGVTNGAHDDVGDGAELLRTALGHNVVGDRSKRP